ncbi:MAG: glutamine--fructose-6-phosphate transaminase (isomerizing) [Candidatus Hydrogenedentes bacterium]|nr:glutamine--fructose-6-phosphate transaminase (isomerizing) [Candidatus Hydrogenedentota bacterium]
MCGIVGYVGPREAQPILLEGLRRLEYRGYDSAGAAIAQDGVLHVRKTVGKLARLAESLQADPLRGHTGIGHTRWATHGSPTETNAHPHQDTNGHISVVHNGIIENYVFLRAELQAEGAVFRSETDTEVLPHLLRRYYTGDLLAAVRQALEQIEGSYAFAALAAEHPEQIVFARKGSPLVLGLGQQENFLASDTNALLPFTRRVIYLEDGHHGLLTADTCQIYDAGGTPVAAAPSEVQQSAAAAEKDGHAHFMLKEIHQQPEVLRHLLLSYAPEHGLAQTHTAGTSIQFPGLGVLEQRLTEIHRIVIVACGTAWHAGLVAKYLLEPWARLPVSVELASEFRYAEPCLDARTLVIAVSQSGETADTLEAVRIARKFLAPVLGVVNVPASSIARAADGLIYLHAGPEIGVASTKAYTAQVTALTLLALHLAQRRGTLPQELMAERLEALRQVPGQMQEILQWSPKLDALAGLPAYKNASHAMFLGRGCNYPSALEGALKLKEISYIHAEGYAAGEMKHGPIALVTEELPVFCIAVQGSVYAKTLSNIQEIRARNGRVLALATEGDTQIAASCHDVFYLPPCPEPFSPLLAALPLQLLAYYIALELGRDVDQPRNLAKSVTVE